MHSLFAVWCERMAGGAAGVRWALDRAGGWAGRGGLMTPPVSNSLDPHSESTASRPRASKRSCSSSL
jgi:hypothetical protein